MRAVYIPDINSEEAVEGALGLARAGYINAVVLELKHDDGSLEFISAQSLAADSGANPETGAARSVIERFQEEGVYVIAQMYAFEDSLASNYARDLSVSTRNGVRWLDWQYHGWLDPYAAGAQDYISALAKEAAALGADEVMLDCFCFPTQGKPQLLYFEEEATTSRADQLDAFAERLCGELAEMGVLLSLRVNASWLETPPQGSGFSAERFAAYGAEIVLEGSADALPEDCTISCELGYTYSDSGAGTAAAALDETAADRDLIVTSPDGRYPVRWE